MPCRWSVQTLSGQVDGSGLYSVSPEAGEVEPGASATITVRLSPQEVEDCSRVLLADIPHLDPTCPPLRRELSGASPAAAAARGAFRTS